MDDCQERCFAPPLFSDSVLQIGSVVDQFFYHSRIGEG